MQPIYNVTERPIPPAAQQLSLDDLGEQIMLAGARRHWRFVPVGPGQLRGTYENSQHEAAIKVVYTQQSYSIFLEDSNNLKQSGNEIHRTYNHWIHNLERDIDDQLYAVAVRQK